jgi:hypothetical protein
MRVQMRALTKNLTSFSCSTLLARLETPILKLREIGSFQEIGFFDEKTGIKEEKIIFFYFKFCKNESVKKNWLITSRCRNPA